MIKQKLKKFISSGGFFQSVLKVGSGSLIGQVISLVTTPVLSRVYSDSAFGERAIIVSTAAIVINLSTLGLNSAIMKPEDDEESKTVFTTAMIANIIVSTLVVLVSGLLNSYFRLFDVSGSYAAALLIVWLYMVINTLQSLAIIYTNRKGRYNKLFVNPIIGAVANVVLAIPLGLLGFGYKGFLITTVLSQFIMALHMLWKDVPIRKGYRWSDFWYVIKKYKEYILYQYPCNFITNVGTEYPTQFLGRNFTAGELGNYSMCLNIMKYPIRLIASPISTVYFRTATEYHRQGKNLGEFTYKMISKILIYSFVPVAVCCLFSEKLFSFALGSTWAMAGTIASIKAVEYVMLFCADCVSYCKVSIGKQKSDLFYSIVRLGVVFVFAVAGHAIFKNLMGTIIMITIGNTLMNIFNMAINFYYLDKKCLVKYCLLAVFYSATVGSLVFLKTVI